MTHSARRVQGEIPGYTNACNKFQLAPGQWTDDCSMALCLADSPSCAPRRGRPFLPGDRFAGAMATSGSR